MVTNNAANNSAMVQKLPEKSPVSEKRSNFCLNWEIGKQKTKNFSKTTGVNGPQPSVKSKEAKSEQCK